jgi:hypothetical protein
MAGIVVVESAPVVPVVKMEFASTSIPLEHVPLHSSFEKLGDTQCHRVMLKARTIYISVNRGVQFKFERVDNDETYQFPIYKACTTVAATYFKNNYILIRNIGPKLIAFGEEAIVADQITGAVNVKCYGSLSAELMCTVSAPIHNTVGQLKTLISEKLVQLEMSSPNMPIVFTDEQINKWHNGAKLSKVFSIVVPKVKKVISKTTNTEVIKNVKAVKKSKK